jgi:hypothetical protein
MYSYLDIRVRRCPLRIISFIPSEDLLYIICIFMDSFNVVFYLHDNMGYFSGHGWSSNVLCCRTSSPRVDSLNFLMVDGFGSQP